MARGFNFAPGASPEVQEAHAPDLDKRRLVELGASKNATVRHAIARRPDCPLGLMATLAHDGSSEVRAAIASNRAAQASVLATLAADRAEEVVLEVVDNPVTPDELLDVLAVHRRATVRAAVQYRREHGGGAKPFHAEDEHTPELADDVRLGAAAMPPPIAPEPAFPVAADQRHEGFAVAMASRDPHEDDAGLAQEASPSLAPVRGFRPPNT